MSKFTTEIRFLRESNFDFGLKDYQIFDEEYRKILNKKILDHYNFHEIGLETEGLFKFYLNTRMQEIMPYFNKLYTAQLKQVNPLFNVEIQESGNRNGEANSKSNSKANANNKGVFHDTPQGKIAKSIDELEYATTATISENDSNSNIEDNTQNQEHYFRNVTGNQGISTSELFIQFKNSLINIDTLIIKNLSDLFIRNLGIGEYYEKN